jgi:hypothetical protein
VVNYTVFSKKRYNKLNVGNVWGNKKANLLNYNGLALKTVGDRSEISNYLREDIERVAMELEK